jgi:hypothetical protein
VRGQEGLEFVLPCCELLRDLGNGIWYVIIHSIIPRTPFFLNLPGRTIHKSTRMLADEIRESSGLSWIERKVLLSSWWE